MHVRRNPRRLAVAATLLLTAALGFVPGTASATPPVVADCTPHQLPGAPGGGGQIIWITDTGLYVGGELRPDHATAQAGWWTHAGSSLDSGWSFHAIAALAGYDSEVLDSNNDGVMVGYDYGDGHGFVYDSRTAALHWLPDLIGGLNVGYSRRINASGEVSGGAYGREGNEVAVVWFPPYTQAKRLPDAGASQSPGTKDYSHNKMFSEADGINDAGDTAGITSLGAHIDEQSLAAREKWFRGGIAPLFQPIEWRSAGVQRLPAGEAQAGAFALNNAGLVVGASDRPGDPSYNWFPAAWRNGQLQDMGAGPDVVWGNAYGVSQGGWAVGGVGLADDSGRGFVWTGAGALQELAPLPGGDGSWAHGADDRLGQLGGSTFFSADGFDQATVWQCPAGFTTG